MTSFGNNTIRVSYSWLCIRSMLSLPVYFIKELYVFFFIFYCIFSFFQGLSDTGSQSDSGLGSDADILEGKYIPGLAV